MHSSTVRKMEEGVEEEQEALVMPWQPLALLCRSPYALRVGASVRTHHVTSQVLPVDAHQSLIGLLGVADLLCDAVLAPQLLDLSVALLTQV